MVINLSNISILQSPFLYLQAAGSTGSDGSADGIHLRWELLRNLGSHIPKGEYASNNIGFNRQSGDYVKIYRSEYTEEFPVAINFVTDIPMIVHDNYKLWIYKHIASNTLIYVYFKNSNSYDSIRSTINPNLQPWQFIKNYGSGLIEITVKDKLFFAVEFKMEQTGNTPELKAETLSIKENLHPFDVLVSCRKKFNSGELCLEKNKPPVFQVNMQKRAAIDIIPPKNENPVADCCKGPNLFFNGSFESGNSGFGTQYQYNNTATSFIPGTYCIASNAASRYPSLSGVPQHGNNFLLVTSSRENNIYAWEEIIKTDRDTEYCLSGWISSLIKDRQQGKLNVRITGISDSSIINYYFDIPSNINIWEKFTISWNSGNNLGAKVQLFFIDSNGVTAVGLDNLCFCTKKSDEKCRVKMISENIKTVRFSSDNSLVKEIQFETYSGYIDGINSKNGWSHIGDFALTKDTPTAFQRLEDVNLYPVHGQWQKFNDDSFVNVLNYKDRWSKTPGGIKQGVEEYISRSETDTAANANLPGNNNVDGSINISYRDLLKIVSMDFHVARMLGLGSIDTVNIQSPDTKYIYLAEYFSAGQLDDIPVARNANHIFVTVPTSKRDSRLPKTPNLLPLTYGLYSDNGSGNLLNVTDQHGYTHDGKSRYINLFSESENLVNTLGDFFVPPLEFCRLQNTDNVFLGIEYKKDGEINWRKPEIAHEQVYMDAGNPTHKETSLIPLYTPQGRPNFIHKETEAGIHHYSSYGINWFSRASKVSSTIVSTDTTNFVKPNTLIPPSNFKIHLIQEESPLQLTTNDEQLLLSNLAGDKTLVRVTFDYNHMHDLTYAFGNEVELFFRQEATGNIRGGLKSVTDDPSNSNISIVRTQSYTYNSTGEIIYPVIPSGMAISHFKGGKFTIGQKQYAISDISTSMVIDEGPIFFLNKIREVLSQGSGNGQYFGVESYTGPSTADIGTLFMAVENINNPNNWGSLNPLTKKVLIGDGSWTTVTEQFTNEDLNVTERTFRGVWQQAEIVPYTAPNTQGVYELTFDSYILQHHPQFTETEPVEWYKGIVRIPIAGNPSEKKVLEILQIINIGNGQNLKLRAYDQTFNDDTILIGQGIEVNFYPGYKVYLYKEDAKSFNQGTIIPAGSESSKTTFMGCRTLDTSSLDPSGNAYSSLIGQPHFMVAQKVIEPLPPQLPMGAMYASPPDFFDKSIYTFTVEFTHTPYAAVFYRANEEDILKILYSSDESNAVNVNSVKASLQAISPDDFFTTRWNELVNAVYNPATKMFNEFLGFGFPIPNNEQYVIPESDTHPFDGINTFEDSVNVNYDELGLISASMNDIIKNAIFEIFVPLTEQPLIYDYVSNSPPLPKKQVIKDGNGRMLDTSDPFFSQAPMAQRISTDKILFADYTLMGSGENIYFYMVREVGDRMKLSQPSGVLGPIQLVNASHAEPPKIMKIYSRMFNQIENIPASVVIEIAKYSEVQNISQIQLYRAYSELHSLSVRTMKLAKTFELAAIDIIGSSVISLIDDFSDEVNPPYGKKVYYRLIAQRNVVYEIADASNIPATVLVEDYASSIPSAVVITGIADNVNPQAPEISFIYDPPLISPPQTLTNVKLTWNKTAYNATYYIYKLNDSGIWNKIKNIFPADYDIEDNSPFVIDLIDTDLNNSDLIKLNSAGENIFHRFTIRVENSSGLLNLQDKPAIL